MKIASIDLGERPVLLAPMEDVTDPAFRLMCKEFGADMVYTEFVSADALIRSVSKTEQKLNISDAERPVAIQIYGRDVDTMVQAARIVEQARPDVIDLNFGCPVKRVAGKGAGAGMLRNIPLMLDITRAVVDAVRLPVTVKTRLGWDAESKIIVTLAEQLQDCGIAALTIHGRTRAQMYTGEADWTLIGEVKNNPRMRIPIIGNGDITTPQRAAECFDRYGVDGIMVGRASFGRPWIFKEIKHYLQTGEETSLSHDTILPVDGSHSYDFPLSGYTGSRYDALSIYATRDPNNDKANAYVAVALTRSLGNSFALGLKVSATQGTVQGWCTNASFADKGVPGWTAGDEHSTMGEIGGTGNSIISVGAYVSSNSYKAENSSSETPTGTILGSLASFSSIGPRADGVVKPDITAPGAIVCSSVSSAGSISIVGKTVNWQNKNYRYGYMSGTSMSAPYVTGVLATWLQAYPRLNPQLVKEIFKTTSEIDEEGDNSWGYGKIDAWEGIKKAIVMREQDAVADAEALTEGVRLLSASEDGIGLLFMHSDRDVTVNIYSISGSVVSGIRLASVEAGEEVRIGSLPCGYYLIKVTGRNTDEVLKVVCKK